MRGRVGFTIALMLVALTVLRWPCGPACAPDAHADRAPFCHGDSSAVETLTAASHDCRDHAAAPAVVSTASRLTDLAAAPLTIGPVTSLELAVGAAIVAAGRPHAPPPLAARSLQLRI
jgi:hypothetical protein